MFDELQSELSEARGVVLYMDAVPLLDAGGLSALNHFIQACRQQGVELIVADLQFQPLRALARAGMAPVEGELKFTPTLAEALQPLLKMETKC